MAESQAFDEVEILDYVLSVSIEENRFHFRLFWRDSVILNHIFDSVDEGIEELNASFFGLEFDVYGPQEREQARDQFYRVIHTRWRWLHK